MLLPAVALAMESVPLVTRIAFMIAAAVMFTGPLNFTVRGTWGRFVVFVAGEETRTVGPVVTRGTRAGPIPVAVAGRVPGRAGEDARRHRRGRGTRGQVEAIEVSNPLKLVSGRPRDLDSGGTEAGYRLAEEYRHRDRRIADVVAAVDISVTVGDVVSMTQLTEVVPLPATAGSN